MLWLKGKSLVPNFIIQKSKGDSSFCTLPVQWLEQDSQDNYVCALASHPKESQNTVLAQWGSPNSLLSPWMPFLVTWKISSLTVCLPTAPHKSTYQKFSKYELNGGGVWRKFSLKERNPLLKDAMACLHEERLPGCLQQNPVLHNNSGCNVSLRVTWSVFTQPSVRVLWPLTLKVTISLLW